jgi:hypothetical protein
MPLEEDLRHRKVHDGIAKELEALVVATRRVRMLMEVAAVDEGLVEEIGVAKLETKALRERGCPGHGIRMRGA